MSINGDHIEEVEIKPNVDDADEDNINGAGDAGDRTSGEAEIEESFQDAQGPNGTFGENDDDAGGGEVARGISSKDEEIKENADDADGINDISGQGQENIDDAGDDGAGVGISNEIEEINENVDDVDGINSTSGEGEENNDGAGSSKDTSSEDEEIESSGDVEEDPVELFSLPSDEVLEHDFVCAYQRVVPGDVHGRVVLLEGRMYIFAHFICFYTEYLIMSEKLKIPFHRITSVRADHRQGIFQNAIEIIADEEVFFFATTSDEAFRLINDKWQKINLNDPQTISKELAAYRVSNSKSVFTPSWIVEDVDAPNISKEYTMVFESKFPMNVERFFRSLYSDNCRGSPDTDGKGDPEFKWSRWRPDDKYGYVRDISSRTEFNNIAGDSSTGRIKEFEKFRVYRNSHLVITTSLGIYDESNDEHCFDVELICDVQKDSDESKEGCICRLYVHVTTIKTDFGEGNVDQFIVDHYLKTLKDIIKTVQDNQEIEGLESGILRIHILDGEGPRIHDLNQQVTLKCEFVNGDDDLDFESSPINLAKELDYREAFADAFLGLKLGSLMYMIIPPTIRNKPGYIYMLVTLEGIGDEKIEEDSFDSESDSKAPKNTTDSKIMKRAKKTGQNSQLSSDSKAPKPEVSDEVLSDTKHSEKVNTTYSKIIKSLVAGTAVAYSISKIMGMKRVKKIRQNSQLSSGTGNRLSITKAMELTQERGRHPAEIMYQVVTLGEGNGITKYQPGCFIYIKTGSVEPVSFEGPPPELAINLARGYEEIIGSMAPDEGSIITRMEEAIVGMKVNERRKITIPPVVHCLREVLYVDLTLTKIKDAPRPSKNNLLSSKM